MRLFPATYVHLVIPALAGMFALCLAACSADKGTSLPEESVDPWLVQPYAADNGTTEFYYQDKTFPKCNLSAWTPEDIPSNAIFWGNSLTKGNNTFGMNATDSSKDYSSYISQYFFSKNPSYKYQRISALKFEQFNSIEQQQQLLEQEDNLLPQLNDSTDFVCIQIGDNVSDDSALNIFESTLLNLFANVCSLAPNAHVVLAGEWYSTKYKQEMMQRVANMVGIPFIDFSDLNTKENRSTVGTIVQFDETLGDSLVYTQLSISKRGHELEQDTLHVDFDVEEESYHADIAVEHYVDEDFKNTVYWTGMQTVTKDPFKASHPNNEGFRKIAERILTGLGYSL